MALRAVGFDIDGTLYPDNRAFRRSIPFFLVNARLVMAFSRTRKEMRRLAGSEEMAGDVSDSEVRIFSRELGCDTDKARKFRDERIYAGWERIFSKVRTYPEVRESLLRLKAAGLKLAALSDFPVGAKLRYFGLDDLFDSVLGFPESGGLKPKPEPFVTMAKELAVEPAEILYIGNKLEYDVYGAEGAGMRGALIGPPGRSAPEGTLVYRDYRHMADSILSEVRQ